MSGIQVGYAREMRVAAASIVAKNHLGSGRVLARSFLDYHPEIPFYLLVADEVDGLIDPQCEPFQLVELGELQVENCRGLCFRYPQQPLSYACTPLLLLHLLDRGFDQVLFFKQESLVLGRMDDALDRLRRCSALLTPHLVEPMEGPEAAERELRVLQSGVYNIGFVGVADTPETRQLLSWWSDRTEKFCLHDVGRGMHFEQRWMDLAPVYFEGVEQLRDPAYNVCHWNLPQREVRVRDGAVLVDGRRCRLFRFSGFDPENPDQPTRYYERPSMDEIGEAAAVYKMYLARLLEHDHWTATTLPYAWDHFDNGVAIPEVVREIYRENESLGNFRGDPFSTSDPGGVFAWLSAPRSDDVSSVEPISNLWFGVWQLRPDLQTAYPEPLGNDRVGFQAWIRSSGIREHSIPPELVTP